MKVLLFDIDGTLLFSGGAGLNAMNQAFADLHGVAQAFQGISLAGRTDTSILQDVMFKYKIPATEANFTLYKEHYFSLLQHEMNLPLQGKSLMPGVASLLPALQKREEVYMGLLTGNWRVSAYIKLGQFAIDHYFAFGAFADDSPQRNDLLPFALRRFTERFGLRPASKEVYVIGDTPSDILCAQPYGAIAVGIAAAHFSKAQLEEYHPDFIFEDLINTEALIKFLG
jgi:phosphoglycolate phosphatase